MIDRVTIQGFKSIVGAEIALGRLNVFVGANGSGKSNVLEAVGLLGCAVSGRVGEEAFRFRGVRPGSPKLFKTAFDGERIPRLIRLEAAAGRDEYRVSLDNPTERPNTFWTLSAETIEAAGRSVASRSLAGASFMDDKGARLTAAKPEKSQGIVPLLRTLRGDEPAGELLRALESFAIYTPFTPMLRGMIPDPSPREPVGLTGGGLTEALRDLTARDHVAAAALQREVLALVDWASAFRTSRFEGPAGRPLYFVDAKMRPGRNTLAAADASEGALYVIFLMILLLHPAAPRFFAVDNIDSALHPRLARALVGRAQELLLANGNDRQLIVTTHNPLVLDALRLSDDRVRLFVVSRESGTGFTTIRRIEHSDALERAKARGRTLSQLWVEGTLGGVPDLM
jgi:predicted ATPase